MDEQKFGKSLSNKRTENVGLALLLRDPRFQAPDLAAKRRIIELLPVQGEWGTQTFDAVMTPTPREPVTAANVERYLPELVLIEMKTTRKPIKDQTLNSFFFGATDREYQMARALGDKYMFAFCVLNTDNVYGREFFVLLTLEEVERRTRAKRIQYQVNFRSDIVLDPDAHPEDRVGPVVLRAAEDVPPYGARD